MITGASVVLLVNVLATVLKKYVAPKFGRTGVQVTVFVLALIGAIYMNYGADYKVYLAEAALVFSLAVTLYEVILNRLPFFKGK